MSAHTVKNIYNTTAIVVLDKGFVYVGELSQHDEKTFVLSKAQNIRRWGTEKGLGQLVLKGPARDTVLDPAGVVIFPLHALVQVLPVRAEQWKL